MRDIRADLEDRAQLIGEQIKAAQSAFERQMETIQDEHEKKLDKLRVTLDAVKTLLGSEHHFLTSAQAPDEQSQPSEREPQRARPQHADLKKTLADFIIRELSDRGPVSKDNLLKSAVRQGYCGNGDNTERTFEEALAQSKKTGSIRQLPNGNFALPTLADTIRLRRAG